MNMSDNIPGYETIAFSETALDICEQASAVGAAEADIDARRRTRP